MESKFPIGKFFNKGEAFVAGYATKASPLSRLFEPERLENSSGRMLRNLQRQNSRIDRLKKQLYYTK
ncbi:hypothetical protein HMPREF1986_01247 [Oribacterium sp. oral taxon 078 str. F0263]|nr:hypothetical protein HMPREF1986_01247 [Oribacterium sp. oral taxon 078 str. F0263]